MESPEPMPQGWAGIPGWTNQFVPLPGASLRRRSWLSGGATSNGSKIPI